MQPDEKSEKPASARPLHREHVDDFQRLRLVPRSVRVTDSTLINRLPDPTPALTISGKFLIESLASHSRRPRPLVLSRKLLQLEEPRRASERDRRISKKNSTSRRVPNFRDNHPLQRVPARPRAGYFPIKIPPSRSTLANKTPTSPRDPAISQRPMHSCGVACESTTPRESNARRTRGNAWLALGKCISIDGVHPMAQWPERTELGASTRRSAIRWVSAGLRFQVRAEWMVWAPIWDGTRDGKPAARATSKPAGRCSCCRVGCSWFVQPVAWQRNSLG